MGAITDREFPEPIQSMKLSISNCSHFVKDDQLHRMRVQTIVGHVPRVLAPHIDQAVYEQLKNSVSGQQKRSVIRKRVSQQCAKVTKQWIVYGVFRNLRIFIR